MMERYSWQRLKDGWVRGATVYKGQPTFMNDKQMKELTEGGRIKPSSD